MRFEGKKNLVIHAFLLFITLIVTSIVAFLVVPGELRAEKFYLCLFLVLLLEVFGFLFPLFLGKGRNGVFRVHLGVSVFLCVYSVGVMILVLLAFGPGAFSTVVALQLAWLIFFVLALGANAMGFWRVLAKRRNAPVAGVQNQFDAFCDRLMVIEVKEADPLKEAFATFRDELQYATEVSLPSGETMVEELDTCLERMERELTDLEAAANPRNIVPSSKPVGEAVSMLDWELKRTKQALRRRERLAG